MLRQVLLGALLSVIFGAPHHNGISIPHLDGRIVGGFPVNIEEFSYHGSLQYFGDYACGVVIVSTTHVLTSAHCTDGLPALSLRIRAGSTFRQTGGVQVEVSEIHQHPLYDDYYYDFDISVLTLAATLSLSNTISVIAMPHLDEPYLPGAESIITGWGALTEGGTSPQQLQAVAIPVMSLADCRDILALSSTSLTARMLCAGVPEGGRDSCTGDAGGALVIDSKVFGIVSWGYGCARPSSPGVYANVANLRSFITSVVGF